MLQSRFYHDILQEKQTHGISSFSLESYGIKWGVFIGWVVYLSHSFLLKRCYLCSFSLNSFIPNFLMAMKEDGRELWFSNEGLNGISIWRRNIIQKHNSDLCCKHRTQIYTNMDNWKPFFSLSPKSYWLAAKKTFRIFKKVQSADNYLPTNGNDTLIYIQRKCRMISSGKCLLRIFSSHFPSKHYIKS